MFQQALILETERGAFSISERPIPRPAAGELVVKLRAVALNPVDWKIQATGYLVEGYPAVLGSDAAGDIQEVGEGVDGWTKGDKVFFQGFYRNDKATFQQYASVPAELVARIPSRYTYSQVASIPVALTAAIFGLYGPSPIGIGLNPTIDPAVKRTGEPVVVIGGSTSVGQYATQLLRYLDFSPIMVYASSKHSQYLKSLGATHIVDRQLVPLPAFPSAIKEITSSEVKIVFDAVGGTEALNAGFECLATGGELVTVDSTSRADRGGPKTPPPEGKTLLAVFGTVRLPHGRAFGNILYEKLPSLIEHGIIVPNRVEDLPNGLDGIVDGLERLKRNEISGKKLIAHPQDSLK